MAVKMTKIDFSAPKTILAGANSPSFAIEQLIEAESELATSVDGRLIVKAGTIYPANDETAVGIIMNDCDVTDGDVVAPMLIFGVVEASKLPVEITEEAYGALKNIGVVPVPTFE